MDQNNSDSVNPKGMKRVLRAFKYRNYRLFFTGQGISVIGSWMQRIAMSWLVYHITNSPFLLGLVGFTGQIPTLILAPYAGVLSDRSNRIRIITLTQFLALLQALTLSILVLTDKISVWHIVSLSIFLGIVTAFDNPTRQAFVVEMVENKEDLGNAIALNSFMFNSARLIGPSIAGILIAIAGEGICFLINAISYVAVIVALFMMKVKPKQKTESKKRVWQELKEGSTYVLGFPPIRNILLLLSLISLVGMPYTILLPIFAKNVLGGGPQTLGFLMAGVGCGAIGGAIFLASRKNAQGLDGIIPIASVVFGIGLISFSLSRIFFVSLILIAVSGFGMMVQNVSSNTFIQTIVDDDKRGRVMSFHSMSFMGIAPFGSLLAGSLASRIGAPNTLMLGGIACLLGATAFASQLPKMRSRLT